MNKLFIVIIGIIFIIGLSSENFAQRRYNHRSYKPKSFRTSFKFSNSKKYSRRTTTYKQPNLKSKSSLYTAKNKLKRKTSYSLNTRLNYPSYSRRSAMIYRKYKSRRY